VLDAKGVDAISKLPTKQELMQNTAVAIKQTSVKLARVLKQAGFGPSLTPTPTYPDTGPNPGPYLAPTHTRPLTPHPSSLTPHPSPQAGGRGAAYRQGRQGGAGQQARARGQRHEHQARRQLEPTSLC
jgi:hypothetical protein